MIQYNPTVSGSLIITGSLIVSEQISGTITASYADYNNIVNKPTLVSGSSQLTASLDEHYVISGSITQTTWDNIASKPNGIVSSSIQVLGGTDIVSSSTQLKVLLPNGSVSGSIQVLGGTNIVSGSTQILGLGFVTGSYVTINEYNYLTQSFNIISASVVTIENDIDAGIYATTGSNTFIGTQIITGSTYITGDLIVQGSSSLENITASAVSIGTNIVYLNTDTPAVRFAGLSVFDSGSTAGTGSLLYDSENERWVYQKASGSSYSGGMLISGPRNLGALGDEVGMPTNKLIMGIGGDHISSSNIYHNGTDTAFAGNVEVTGSIRGQILATNGVVSGSSQITFSGISSLPTLVSSSSQVSFTGIVDKPTLVSGSSQIDVMSTTNIARLATTGSNIFIGNQTITGSLFVSGSNTGVTPLVAFRASGTGTFQRGIQLLNPGMGNGDSIMYSVGKADNSKNMGQFYFHHAGDSSNNNRISVGLHSVDDVFNIMGSNEVLIGTTTTNSAGKLQVAGNIVPEANGTRDLGSTSYRWSTVYTSDLSLNNGIGDWTIVEGEDDLFLYNNKKGKVYKFALTEVDPSVATPKKS
jgi:hypothetical protein